MVTPGGPGGVRPISTGRRSARVVKRAVNFFEEGLDKQKASCKNICICILCNSPGLISDLGDKGI